MPQQNTTKIDLTSSYSYFTKSPSDSGPHDANRKSLLLQRTTMAWTGEGPSLFAFSARMLLFATLAVALRFVCRGYILRVLGLSDLCMLLTFVRIQRDARGIVPPPLC